MKRILVVDDEAPVRKVLAEFLTRRGYAVAEAETGPLALAYVEGYPPDMVLLDIRMAGMDGIEVLRRIKQRHADACVIMLTGEADEDISRKAMELGAADYLVKPIRFEQLDAHLSVHLLLQSEA